jgi:hypothetical protein
MIEQPVRTPHKKQVWVSKPNHLRNTLDTLPDISSDPLPRAPQPLKKPKTHKQTPPKREVRFHYDYYEREGNLAALGGTEMNDGFLGRVEGTQIAPPMVFMIFLLKDVLRCLEVLCLLLLGLRQ